MDQQPPHRPNRLQACTPALLCCSCQGVGAGGLSKAKRRPRRSGSPSWKTGSCCPRIFAGGGGSPGPRARSWPQVGGQVVCPVLADGQGRAGALQQTAREAAARRHSLQYRRGASPRVERTRLRDALDRKSVKRYCSNAWWRQGNCLTMRAAATPSPFASTSLASSMRSRCFQGSVWSGMGC